MFSAPTAVPDELDRLFHRLVANLSDLDPSRLHGPFAVSELYENLVPYRTHRKQLRIDTKQDYEMVLLRLLAGERGYAAVEPEEVREALAREAAGVNPDTGLFRRYAGAKVRLDPDRVNDALGRTRPERDALAPPAPVEVETPAPPPAAAPMPELSVLEAPRAERPDLDAAALVAEGEEEPAQYRPRAELPFSLEEDEEAEPPPTLPRQPSAGSASCAYCGGELPLGRAVMFCPHCGQNVGVVHCPACGSELDVGWRYCITCGNKMAGLG